MFIGKIARLFTFLLMIATVTWAQSAEPKQQIRTVTIPISIFTKTELKENQVGEYVQMDRLIVREDKEEQKVLSIRSVSDSPLSIAIVIQEDLSSNFNLQIKDIQAFIKALPRGSRVLVAYSRAGSVQIRQRFTDNLEQAAGALRIVAGSPASGPRSPYDAVQDVLGRFDAVPAGRRAILLFSDGLDLSQGANLASITQSFDLEQAVLKAQRKGVPIYSFYAPTTSIEREYSNFSFVAQGALNKISEETGGRAFFQGSIAPVSYIPFFRELNVLLNRQFALTYLSTHMKKGYYKVDVMSTNPEVRIEHPKGYYYR
jgi:hypothetical protein